MPSKTPISKDKKDASFFKAAKDFFMPLLCSNTVGYFMSKPLLMYYSHNLWAFKGSRHVILPAY